MRKILKEGVDFGKVAEKAVAIIKGKGYDVIMFTDDGMETSDPEEARRLYVKEPNFMITVDEDAAVVRINKNSNVELDQLAPIMKQIKNLAREYMLKSELKVFGKEITPKDFAYQAKKLRDSKMNESTSYDKLRDWKAHASNSGFVIKTKDDKLGTAYNAYKNGKLVGAWYKIIGGTEGWFKESKVTEASLSRMKGSKKTSYQTLESTKIIVRHRKPVDEDVRGSRSRQIKAIFIERAGERFKFPHNNLAGARAMARHIDEGGEIHDSVGQYIIESVGNMIKLAEFVRYSRTNKLINEDSEDIVKIVRENINAYRKELQRFQGATTYAKMCEKIADREGSELEEDTADLKDMFTVRKFDEKIGETLPLIKRLVTEKNAWRSMIEEASEEAFVVTSTEELIEGDAIEFDSPQQKLGYKLRTLSERAVEESDLSKFMHKVSGKIIEGAELSRFEKSVMRNVLEHIVVVEEDATEEDGLVDKLDEVMNDFERKMKLLEFDLDWEDEEAEEELYKGFYGNDDELAGLSIRSRRKDSNWGEEDEGDMFGVNDTSCPDCTDVYTDGDPDCPRCGGTGEVFEARYDPVEEVSGPCRWWAMCDNDATTTEPHPILGDVPICDRCVSKLRKIEGMERKPEGLGEDGYEDDPLEGSYKLSTDKNVPFQAHVTKAGGRFADKYIVNYGPTSRGGKRATRLMSADEVQTLVVDKASSLAEDPGDWDHGYNYEGPQSDDLGYDPETQWMDPAGGIHDNDEEDPAAMYEDESDNKVKKLISRSVSTATMGERVRQELGMKAKSHKGGHNQVQAVYKGEHQGVPFEIVTTMTRHMGDFTELLVSPEDFPTKAAIGRFYRDIKYRLTRQRTSSGVGATDAQIAGLDEELARMKSLAGIEENVDPEDFMDECPACEGTGKEYGEGGGGDCENCDGNGYV